MEKIYLPYISPISPLTCSSWRSLEKIGVSSMTMPSMTLRLKLSCTRSESEPHRSRKASRESRSTWEMRGDVGRCGEMRGDVGRCGEMWGDLGRCEEADEARERHLRDEGDEDHE